MAKVNISRFGVELHAEGSDEFTRKQAADFLAFFEREDELTARETILLPADSGEACTCPLTEAEQLPGGVEHDVVAIYDDAGIPSIMHRFRRMTDKELFGGSDTIHPAFIIGGEVYDEIYISVYQNTMINGKPYSLPMAEPVCNITMEDFAEACFSKGEGWHCLTAAEWGLLANLSLKNSTLPHGNTNCGSWLGDSSECGTKIENSNKTLTGSGPATWTHDYTPTGVHDLCGNLYEFCRGMRIKDGALQAAKNNDAALPETDLSENGSGWQPIRDISSRPLYVSVGDGILITNSKEIKQNYDGCRWGDVEFGTLSEQLKELGFFPGDQDNYLWVDSTDGEYILYRGGSWVNGVNGVFCGVFCAYLGDARSDAGPNIGGRSAFFKKH